MGNVSREGMARKEYARKRTEEIAEKKAKTRRFLDAGYSRKEVAEFLGVSEATVLNWVKD